MCPRRCWLMGLVPCLVLSSCQRSPESTRAADSPVDVAQVPRSEAEPGPFQPPKPRSDCEVEVDQRTGTLSLGGSRLTTLTESEVVRLLGAPSRRATERDKVRYEEFGDGQSGPTSTMVPVRRDLLIYDELSLVVVLGDGASPVSPRSGLWVFFKGERSFQALLPPPPPPRQFGRCAVWINGEQLDATARAVPNHSAEQETFRLAGLDFTASTASGVVATLHAVSQQPQLTVYLDAPQTQRVAYVEIGAPKP